MRIILDAMGGDHAPQAVVQGAMAAAAEFGVEITLVGRGEDILNCMKELGEDTLPQGMEIANADDVVDAHDDPSTVMHRRKNSSMLIGLKMLAEGQGDAFISCGNTGALLTAATLIVKRIRGIRRAAFGPVIPTKEGAAIIIDAGANIDCAPEFLLQFGCMGSYYAKAFLKQSNPRVGLLNNGTEDSKGMPLQREAYQLLKKAGDDGVIQFVGNVEARDVPLGAADVVVCDGFSGNVLLKSVEGTALFMSSMLKHQVFGRNLWTKIGYLFSRSGVKELKRTMDYRETGGTLLLGIGKPVIKAHGSSDARAIRSAVRQAVQAVNSGVCEHIRENISQMTITKE